MKKSFFLSITVLTLHLSGAIVLSDATNDEDRIIAAGHNAVAIPFKASSTSGDHLESIKLVIDDPGQSIAEIFLCRFTSEPGNAEIYAPSNRLRVVKGKIENENIILEKSLRLGAQIPKIANYGIGVTTKAKATGSFSIQIKNMKISGEEEEFSTKVVRFKIDNRVVPFTANYKKIQKDGFPAYEVTVTTDGALAYPPMISTHYQNFRLKDWWKDDRYRVEMNKNSENTYLYTVRSLTPLTGNNLSEPPVSYKLIPPPNDWQGRADNTGRDIIDGDPIGYFQRMPGGVRWLGAANPTVEFDLKETKKVMAVDIYYLLFQGTFKLYGKNKPEDNYNLLCEKKVMQSSIPFGPGYMSKRTTMEFPVAECNFIRLEADSEYCLTEVVIWGAGDQIAIPEQAVIFVTGLNGKTTAKQIQLK